MSEGPSKILPNSYQSPNFLVDVVMRFLSGNEQKCVDVICRKTFGWQKRTDRISKSQLKEFTGLNVQTIERCMYELVKYRVVIRVSESVQNLGVKWSIQIDDKLIDLKGLKERAEKRARENHNRTTKAQANHKVGLSNEPTLSNNPTGGSLDEPHKSHYQKPSSSPSSAKLDKVILFYEQEIGKITPSLSEKLITAKNTYSEEWVLEALADAVTYNKPSWAYAETILKRWKQEGKVKTKKANQINKNNRLGFSKRNTQQQPKLDGEALEQARARAKELLLPNSNYSETDREAARRALAKKTHTG